MDNIDIISQLKEATGKNETDISDGNLFKEIGFDGNNPRLGWFKTPSFEDVRQSLDKFSAVAKDKKEFIFVGMGGSINGIKALIEVGGSKNIYALDSLDTEAIDGVLSKVNNLKETLVCAISKSGTTKETQLIANSLKSVYGDVWKNNFLWISDINAFEKLDSMGWEGSDKITIQVDGRADIGGRFSSPHTLVFLAPLFIISGRSIEKIESFWKEYVSKIDGLRNESCSVAKEMVASSNHLFQIRTDDKLAGAINNWMVQLFQESLGSKKEGFYPKTMVTPFNETIVGSYKIDLELAGSDKVSYMALLMYYLQVFVAGFACREKINFVDQPYVEIYKKELKNLEDKEISEGEKVTWENISDVVAEKADKQKRYIDIVCFFALSKQKKDELKNIVAKRIPGKKVFLFEGSDWNHHSYQAAFKDKNTTFFIVSRHEYKDFSEYVDKERIIRNLKTLKAISYATYKTISNHSCYLSFEDE